MQDLCPSPSSLRHLFLIPKNCLIYKVFCREHNEVIKNVPTSNTNSVDSEKCSSVTDGHSPGNWSLPSGLPESAKNVNSQCRATCFTYFLVLEKRLSVTCSRWKKTELRSVIKWEFWPIRSFYCMLCCFDSESKWWIHVSSWITSCEINFFWVISHRYRTRNSSETCAQTAQFWF